MPRKRATPSEPLCEHCHHSTITNVHGLEHEPDWCGACAECNRAVAQTDTLPIDPTGHVVYPGDLDDLPPSSFASGAGAAGRTGSMSMIDPAEWSLDDSHEPTTLKDGTEALLRIIEVARGVSKFTGGTQYTVRFEVPSEPFSKDIADWFDEPTRRLDPKRLNDARLKMLHFMDCFSIDRSRPSDPTEDWIGCEGWCILSLRSSEQFGDQNRIAKFVRAR